MIDKNKINDKTKALERESNITLVSTAVVLGSFFILLYVQSLITVNFIKAQNVLTFIEIAFALIGVITGAIAIVKKKNYLFEYTAFFLVMALGYYLLQNGASGIPGLVKESGNSITVSPAAVKLGEILQSKYIILALWAVNVLYGILTIVLHTVKYSKIKKHRKNSIADTNQ